MPEMLEFADKDFKGAIIKKDLNQQQTYLEQMKKTNEGKVSAEK